MRKVFRLGMVALMVGIFAITSPAKANVVCNTYTYTGDDDSAFAANLPYTLKLGPTEYENVYVSTNGTLTFGSPDGTYWDYYCAELQLRKIALETDTQLAQEIRNL